MIDYKPADAKIHPSGESVLKIWQPTDPYVSKAPGKIITNAMPSAYLFHIIIIVTEKPGSPQDIVHGNVANKWPPAGMY